MQWTITFESHPRLVRVVYSGKFNADDCIRMLDALVSDARWRPGTPILADHREADLTGLDEPTMGRIRIHHALLAGRIGRGRVVFLMRPGRNFGFARQYEMTSESSLPSMMMVFDDEAAALRWLAEPFE